MHMHWRSFVELPHPRVCRCRFGSEDLPLPHARASSRRGYNPDGSCGCGPLYGNPVRRLVLAGSALLFGRRRFGDFSWERSAARRPLVRRRDVPEEFTWALISAVKHPGGDALDEFLYGLDKEVASDNVI
ncbi:hypothetical protein EVAR_84061_1 [Eumeta japonica]|uniref:Uncharacterized protein n=1 Tax=Eumeta variegata TaxID=151549 RepID=A0A4C1ZYZ2_EUMVA|nr:hypothetical protein EVAR_84061_1 [Eumeta japonica]